MQLQNFDTDRFLAEVWQQRPLLIRNPWPAWTNPLDPDDLAGLAGEDEVESRLITQPAGGWAAQHGPVAAPVFGDLGRQPYTLLVQAVDHYVPQVAALLGAFRFIPNWRIDDVMVSYATDGGGVGPHFDHYDVFLIQGLGRRRWRVGAKCDASTPLLPHDDLRLLADFIPTDEWILEPGDILYVPPGFAHDGVALGDDCMTYSIGFRAPSQAELIGNWCDDLVADMDDDDRYADPGLPPQDNPGEITPAALARLHALVTQQLADPAAFARWFGAFSSTPKYPEIDWSPEGPVSAADLPDLLMDGAALLRNPASRFAFVREGDGVVLFVNGEAFDCRGPAAALAQRLCAEDRVIPDPAELADPAAAALLAALLTNGNLTAEDED